MKKKIRDFCINNGFHLHKLHDAGKRQGYGRVRIDQAVIQYYNQRQPEGRLDHAERINIWREIRKIARNIKEKEYLDTEQYIRKIEKENENYEAKLTVLGIISVISISLMILAMV